MEKKKHIPKDTPITIQRSYSSPFTAPRSSALWTSGTEHPTPSPYWRAFELLPPLVVQTMLSLTALHINCYRFLSVSLWDRFLKAGFLGQRVNAYVIWLDIAKSPSTKVAAFCIPSSNVYNGHSLANRVYWQTWILANLLGDKWKFVVVLIYICS